MFFQELANIAYNIIFDTDYFAVFFQNGLLEISIDVLILIGVRLGAKLLRNACS